MTIEMIRQEDFQAAHAADPLPAPDHCVVDGRPILTMSFKGTGVCGELCRKVRDGELTLEA
jgi:hypothetical protein